MAVGGDHVFGRYARSADGEQVEPDLSDWCQLPRYDEPDKLEFPQRHGTGGTLGR